MKINGRKFFCMTTATSTAQEVHNYRLGDDSKQYPRCGRHLRLRVKLPLRNGSRITSPSAKRPREGVFKDSSSWNSDSFRPWPASRLRRILSFVPAVRTSETLSATIPSRHLQSFYPKGIERVQGGVFQVERLGLQGAPRVVGEFHILPHDVIFLKPLTSAI